MSESVADTNKSLEDGKKALDTRWKDVSKQLTERYPDSELIFGYGSGVTYQTGYNYTTSPPLLDAIFVVNDMTDWHSKNYRWNRPHYRGSFI